MKAEYDFARWAEKVAEAARQGVQVEILWQRKLEEEQKQKELAKAS